MNKIKRLFYEYNYNSGKSIVNYNCKNCLFYNKCISITKIIDFPEFSYFIQNCKNYQLKNNDFFKDKIIHGGIVENKSGEILFNNNLQIDLLKIKRFYVIDLFYKNEFRGWHGHKYENKYCLCLSGIIKIGIIKIDNFENPSKNLKPEWYILKENDCEILHISGGYANGIMRINNNGKILFFSDMSISESKKDDYRYDKNLWKNV